MSDRRGPVIWSLVALPLATALIGLLVADCSKGSGDVRAVEVVDRWYTPARTTTSVGMSYGEHPFPVVSTHHEPEHWGVVVRDGDAVRSIATGVAEWACAKPGAIWSLHFRVGHWTGIRYDEQLVLAAPQPEAAP
jgi:hypothetical protein